MQEELLRTLVWLDFRLAVLVTVGVPLVLLGWALVRHIGPMELLMVIYWRVASLLGITVYLMIGAVPFGFVTGWLARILIPISLWFWIDINEELDDLPSSPLKLALTSWRWAATAYCAIGTLVFTPFLGCTFGAGPFATAACQIWFEPPLRYKELFHAGARAEALGLLGWFFLILYGIGFVYFIIFRLTKSGRIAAEE